MREIKGVKIFNWNPRRNNLPYFKRFSVGCRVNNFGDLLGPMVVDLIVRQKAPELKQSAYSDSRTLLSVGSVMHFATNNDVVWGSGVNGKIAKDQHNFKTLDIRAVRGPRTKDWLEQEMGISAPTIFGDPALLLPHLLPSLKAATQHKTRRLALIPNLNDANKYSSHPAYVNPRTDAMKVLHTIAQSEYVIGSSLHALVIAESLGVPVALLVSGAEPQFKYEDYVLGTGRTECLSFSSLDKAIVHVERPGAANSAPLEQWDPAPLLDAFPLDLWMS